MGTVNYLSHITMNHLFIFLGSKWSTRVDDDDDDIKIKQTHAIYLMHVGHLFHVDRCIVLAKKCKYLSRGF